MNTQPDSKASTASRIISGLLSGWGLPATWAKVLAGAIVGAACAYFAATTASCTVSHNYNGADGTTSSWHGSINPAALNPAAQTSSSNNTNNN